MAGSLRLETHVMGIGWHTYVFQTVMHTVRRRGSNHRRGGGLDRLRRQVRAVGGRCRRRDIPGTRSRTRLQLMRRRTLLGRRPSGRQIPGLQRLLHGGSKVRGRRGRRVRGAVRRADDRRRTAKPRSRAGRRPAPRPCRRPHVRRVVLMQRRVIPPAHAHGIVSARSWAPTFARTLHCCDEPPI